MTIVDSAPSLELLSRGLSVLELFTEQTPELSVTEVAVSADLTRATARRILLTLQSLGYLQFTGRTFTIDRGVVDLGWAYLSSMHINDVIHPRVVTLVAQTGLASFVGVLALPEVIYIDRVQPERVLSIASGRGVRLPAHATPSGQVLLATLSDDELNDYFATYELEAFTSHTVVGEAEIRDVIAAVAAQGWALADQQLEIGLRSISSPIFGTDGQMIASISVSSNSVSSSLDEMRGPLLELLQGATADISAAFRALAD